MPAAMYAICGPMNRHQNDCVQSWPSTLYQSPPQKAKRLHCYRVLCRRQQPRSLCAPLLLTIYRPKFWYFDGYLKIDMLRRKQPTKCNKSRLLIFLKQLYMFRETNCRPAAISVHCNKSCIYSQKVLLRLGEFVSRNI